MKITDFCKELEEVFQVSYEEGTTLDQAEKLAAKFLHAQMILSREITATDLDSRMRKTGVKAVRSAVYMAEATKAEKKPTEAMLASLVDSNDLVCGEQRRFDEAEVSKAELERYYDIFSNAHVYYRGIAKGRFD